MKHRSHIKVLNILKKLYIEDRLISFQEVITTFGISKNHFLRYLQIRSFILSFQTCFINIPPLSILEKEVTNNCYSTDLISLLYNMFVEGSHESANSQLEAWRKDLNEEISMTDWKEVCRDAQMQTVNTRLKLLQYN